MQMKKVKAETPSTYVSSTGQVPGKDSEVFLKTVFMFKDPMREGDHILVFCEMLFSTKKMCADGGHEVIKEACDKFGTRK